MAHRKWLYLVSGMLLTLGCEMESGRDDCRVKLDSTVNTWNARLDSMQLEIASMASDRDSLAAEVEILKDSVTQMGGPAQRSPGFKARVIKGKPIELGMPPRDTQRNRNQ